jgi:hypothetical protein
MCIPAVTKIRRDQDPHLTENYASTAENVPDAGVTRVTLPAADA